MGQTLTILGLTTTVLGLASPLGAQMVVAGVVTDSTHRPIVGAEVMIQALGLRAETDPSGRYVLRQVPPGVRLLQVRMLGFHPHGVMIRVTVGDTVRKDFTLTAAPLELPTVEVEGKIEGPRGIGVEAFEERRRMGFGKFIADSTLRKNEHLRLPDLLNRHVGIGFRRISTGLVAASRRYTGPQGEPCYMQVIVDGVVLNRAVSPISNTGKPGGVDSLMRPPPDLLAYDVASIQAVEVYRSAAETPIEFGGTGAACGTVVIWSRRGP